MSDVLWAKPHKRLEAIDTLYGILEGGDKNIVVYMRLAERLSEDRQYKQSMAVLKEALEVVTGTLKDHVKQEELLVKIYLQLSDAQRHLNGDIEQARKYLQEAEKVAT